MSNSYKQSFKSTDPTSIALSIYNCGLQRCERGHMWGPGIRDHYLVHLVTEGVGHYSVNGREFTLAVGDLFFAKPNLRITYWADEEHPWEYYWVGFNGSNAAHLVQQLPFTEDLPIHHCAQPDKARTLLHNIYLSRGPEPYQETRMLGYLHLFIALLGAENRTGARPQLDTGAQYVQDALKHIQFNYSHNIGVDDIARAVGVSRSHLYRVFMAHTGQSPIDYLTHYRVNEACALLTGTNLTIAEVAYSVGFDDQFYFSRVFKKVKGVPPSRYAETGAAPK